MWKAQCPDFLDFVPAVLLGAHSVCDLVSCRLTTLTVDLLVSITPELWTIISCCGSSISNGLTGNLGGDLMERELWIPTRRPEFAAVPAFPRLQQETAAPGVSAQFLSFSVSPHPVHYLIL